ncbi:MAG: hypothetical protein DRN81_01140 [Thermoproteota archaeon]|nr:MAG: hypothetical protein DRN81_01140 [Candidatus Korarchaeota archaeon]
MKKIANCVFEREVLKEKKKCVVLFSSTICRHCNEIRIILRKIEKKSENMCFFEIEFLDNMELARQYSIAFLPTVIVFDNGQVISMIQGIKTEKKYFDKVGVKY